MKNRKSLGGDDPFVVDIYPLELARRIAEEKMGRSGPTGGDRQIEERRREPVGRASWPE